MLLKSNKIIIEEKNQSRFYKSNLSNLIKQKPNKKSLGIAKTKLFFYLVGSSKPDNGFKRLLRYKLGEPPVLIDTFLIESSIGSMKNYLQTEGFYYPDISYKVKANKRNTKARVQYFIKLNKPYTIWHTDWHIADFYIDSILRQNNDESFIRHGNRIRLENLYNEQNRITNVLKNNGYFAFRKEDIDFDIDTAVGDFRISVSPNIDNPYEYGKHKAYMIKDVLIEIDYNTNDSMTKPLTLKTFNYQNKGYQLNPKVIERTLLFEKNQLYNQQKITRSYNRLNELQLFRTIAFNPVINANKDTPEINLQVKLQPNKKFDFAIEPQAITTDQANIISGATYRNYGVAAIFQLLQRNVFNNGELLQWRYRSSFEAQRGPNIPSRPFINSFENAITANLILPKFLFFEQYEKRFNSISNKTIISASAIYEQNVDWKRYLLTTSLNYQINKQLINFNITPIAVSFVRTDFANRTLEQQSLNDPFLQSIFTNNLIFDARFGFVYSNQTIRKNRNYIFFRWDVLESAGNLIMLLKNAFSTAKSDSGYKTILGVPIFQYYKTWADFRFNQFLDVNNKIAYRFAAGFALPYGNTPDYVPFDRRFFIGGANSIRAFLPRSIGPGSFESPNFFDRSGDVKFETNIEYRYNVFKQLFEGAVFIDAGNIYRIKDDGRPGATFKFNSFYNDMAVGVGIGLRLNLDFLIFRIDPALPLRDPRKPLKERWVPSTAGSFADWFKQIAINFGVGYPF
jgi:outer membrane protein assembly factor BamA